MSESDPMGENNFICHLCGESVNLRNDTNTDEDGKIVHLDCYLKSVRVPGRAPIANQPAE